MIRGRQTRQPDQEWKIVVPRAVSGSAATAPYAGQSIPPAARWHWIGPDAVFRRPGERWTGESLRAALLAGEAVALNLGQIIMLAGDLVATFAALKNPGVRSLFKRLRDRSGSMVASISRIHNPRGLQPAESEAPPRGNHWPGHRRARQSQCLA